MGVLQEQLVLAGVRRLVEDGTEAPNVKTLATQLLKAANKLDAPKGFGGFGATYMPRLWQVQLLFDVPVQVQDPKRFPPDTQEGMSVAVWRDFLHDIEHLLAEFRRKEPSAAIQKRRQPNDAESEILARAPLSKFLWKHLKVPEPEQKPAKKSVKERRETLYEKDSAAVAERIARQIETWIPGSRARLSKRDPGWIVKTPGDRRSAIVVRVIDKAPDAVTLEWTLFGTTGSATFTVSDLAGMKSAMQSMQHGVSGETIGHVVNLSPTQRAILKRSNLESRRMLSIFQ